MNNSSNYKNPFAILSWLNLGIGLLMLIWQMYFGGLTASFQISYFAIMLLLTGIPHGGLDHVIAKNTAVMQKKIFTLYFFIKRYLLVIAIYSMCWITFPALSLLFFIVISAWHFGETDISYVNQKIFLSISRFCWGAFVLLLILLMHQKETTEVLIRISKKSNQIMHLWQACINNDRIILIAAATLNVILLGTAYLTNQLKFPITRLINLLVILIITIFLPLLPAFALYFGGWHAIRSFELIFNFLNKKDNIIVKNPLMMWAKSLPMSILAVAAFLIALAIWNRSDITWDPLPMVFIFLSVITLPHLDVMDQMTRKDSLMKNK
jgi:Brp/Blh family beta-carotene 15,15'-monooxygenase